MKKNKIIFLLLILIILSLTLFIKKFFYKKLSDQKVLITPYKVVDKFGAVREYTVYLPKKEKKKRFPLIVYFHGVMSPEFRKIPALATYTGSPVEETGLIKFCQKKGIILVAMKPYYSYFFLGEKAKGWSPFEKELDGIQKVIKTIIKNFNVDKKRVYLYGISAGAVIAHHIANKNPSLISGIISHSQGYISEKNNILKPLPKNKIYFGVVFTYTKGDYKNIITIVEKSYKMYKKAGFNTILLKNSPPLSHKWAKSMNGVFFSYVEKLNPKIKK